MDAERWQRIKKLLDACADMGPDERTTWLDEACADDLTLRAEVESYLVFEEDLDALETPPSSDPFAEALITPPDDADKGRRIGPYRLHELLGRGGMGAVYEAHREAEFEQQVAIKLVRAGFENPTTLERFHTERQILAKLEHPNIARLLDGGTTEDGRPFFVMELIDGQPIDRYCDQHRLTTRQRLELVLQICDALAFAHRNLVLHLDLKPGNILVTADGVPKLLDFGIGKLLRHEREPAQGAGEDGPRPMTLSYASPDQLMGDPLSTSSDVYSLGVVLYELLTGRLPCGPYSKDQAALAWAICRDEPTRPSTAVKRTTTVGFGERREALEPAEVAEGRESSPSALVRRLRGDLDAILLRCLQKNPAERYDSVEQMASDLRRHLDHLPVKAHPGGALYRGAKFVRRNRWPLAVGSVLLTLILGFTLALSNQLRHTERQRQRSVRLSDFMVQLFRAAEPDRGAGETSVRELIDIGRQRLDSELEGEPEVRAQLLTTLGRVYFRLGYYAAAQEAQETALVILREAIRRDHPDIATVLNDLATITYTRGEYAQSEGYSRQSLAMRRRLGTEKDLIKPANNLASILLLRGKLDEAQAIYAENLVRRRAKHGNRHPNVARSLRSLALVHFLRGDFETAEPLYRESLAIYLEHYGRRSTRFAASLVSLGQVAHARGELDEAEALFLEALAIRGRLLESDHLDIATLHANLARLMLDRGELETAEVLLEHALGPVYRQKAEGDWKRAELESLYGAYLTARGHFDQAEACLEEGYRTLEAVRGPDILPTRDARSRLDALRQLRETNPRPR